MSAFRATALGSCRGGIELLKDLAFVTEKAEPDASSELDYWMGTLPDGCIRGSLLFEGKRHEDLDPLFQNYFPKTFAVTDDCVTNAASA